MCVNETGREIWQIVCVPKVTETLHFGVDTLNQMRLSAGTEQGWGMKSGIVEKAIEILDRKFSIKEQSSLSIKEHLISHLVNAIIFWVPIIY